MTKISVISWIQYGIQDPNSEMEKKIVPLSLSLQNASKLSHLYFVINKRKGPQQQHHPLHTIPYLSFSVSVSIKTGVDFLTISPFLVPCLINGSNLGNGGECRDVHRCDLVFTREEIRHCLRRHYWHRSIHPRLYSALFLLLTGSIFLFFCLAVITHNPLDVSIGV